MINRNTAQVYRSILLTTVLLCSAISLTYAQQQVQFTQYMFNQLVLNPAFAGNDDALSITLLNRNQWASVSGAPVTQTFSAHTFFGQKQIGAGLSILNDKIGVHKAQNIQGDISYRLPFSKSNFLSFGLRTGVSVRKSDYNSISGNTMDPLLANSGFSQTSFVLGAGLYYQNPRLQLGLSVPNLIPQKVNVNDTLTIRWRNAQYFAFARYKWALNNTIEFSPALLIKYFSGLPISYDVNASVIVKKVLTMGLSYRKKESIAFMLKAKVTPQLHVGYAFDYGVGKIASVSNGSHELMLNYVFRYTNNNTVSPR